MMNNLSDYMKLCFLALYNSVNEMAYDVLKEHGHNTLSYLSKAVGININISYILIIFSIIVMEYVTHDLILSHFLLVG